MASSRDINGMTAQNWRSANTKRIAAEKLTVKNDNIKLFDAIKNIVSSAVEEIHGSAADDKYRYIVDLIMMRVRAAIETALIDNNTTLINDIQSKIGDIIANNNDLIDYIADSTQAKLVSSNTVLKQIADIVLQLIKDNNNTVATEEKTEKPSQQTNNTEAKEDKQDQNNKQEKQINSAALKAQATFEKISATLNLNIDKLQKLIQQNIDLINSTTNVGMTKTKSVLSKKQFKQFLGIVKSQMSYTNFVLEELNDNLNEQLDTINTNIVKVYNILKAEKGSNIGKYILMFGIIVGILATVFWDNIKEKLKKWFGEDNLVSLLEKLINKIPFEAILTKGIEKLFDIVSTAFHNFVSSPMQYIIDSLKKTWDRLKSFANDVWNWVTGKSKEVETAQNENEKKAEKSVEDKLNESVNTLDSNLTNKSEQMMAECNASLNEQNNALADSTKKVEDATTELNNNVESSATELTKATEDATAKLNENTLPNLETQIDNNTSKSINSLDDKMSGKIDEAAGKLDEHISNIDKTIKENGAPTDVDKKALDELQKNSDSDAKLDQPIDKNIEMPSTVIQTTSTEQGKNVDLYSNKSDVEAAKRNAAEVDQLNDDFLPPNVENNQTVNNNTKLEQRLIITGPNGEQLDKAAIDKKAADFNNVIETLSNAEKDLKNNNASLENLKTDVDSYFKTLNGCVKNIIALNNKTAEQTAVIISSNNKQSSQADAGLEDM